ncbi:MAG: methyltransferase [Planctomycetota bacterium]
MSRDWTSDEILNLGRSYQTACVLAAAVDLDVFSTLATGDLSAAALAKQLATDIRGTAILLDALTALELLEKNNNLYRLPPNLTNMLSATGTRREVLAMAQHQANCMRSWARLTTVVQSGQPTARTASIRGAEADQAAFVEAMHCSSAPQAEELIAALQPLVFRHLLDVGGATGTWTSAFLRAVPDATATLFDLPHVMPLARRRLSAEDLIDRVTLVAGDFYSDPLPAGVDLVWLGAIVHQNSRAQNRALFHKVHAALEPGGQVLIRDVLMDDTRTQPILGALFAINMLVATDGGGTFTFDELRADLEAAGLTNATTVRRGEFMDSLVRAVRPE